MKYSFVKIIGLLALILSFGSCVKDTDFDQFQDTLLTPIVDLNLVFWEVEAIRFEDPSGNLPSLIVRDTTEIRFLDDSDTQDSMVRADFLFEFENATPTSYALTMDFINLSGNVTYSLQTTVPAGDPTSPEFYDYLKEVVAPEINQVTQANRLAISAEPLGSISNQGRLTMRSKARFYLEISGQ
jgi:hypothetical protein